jgi:hypothetical protein
MDPFTALGASSAAVQFFDLVAKLLSTTVTIYKGSGDSLASSQDLSTITTDIRSFNDRVLQSTPSLLQSSDPQYGDIRDLCKCCNDVAKELIGALGKIRKRRGTRWDSFRAALATIWSEGEIRSLQGRVDGYRQQISLKILVNIQEVVVDIQ